jgi:hypothetical protein
VTETAKTMAGNYVTEIAISKEEEDKMQNKGKQA